MRQSTRLSTTDVAVLLHLLVHPDASYGDMAAMLGVGKATAHASVARLLRSGLAHAVGQSGVAAALGPAGEFLQYGAAYAFPAVTVPRARGIRTGFAAPGNEGLNALDVFPMVWPSRLGNAFGMGVTPLVPRAPDVSFRDPALYRLLALVDVLRLGDARAREVARAAVLEALAAVAT